MAALLRFILTSFNIVSFQCLLSASAGTSHSGGLLFGQPPAEPPHRPMHCEPHNNGHRNYGTSPRASCSVGPFGDHSDIKDSLSREIPAELQGVSVKELIKALGRFYFKCNLSYGIFGKVSFRFLYQIFRGNII